MTPSPKETIAVVGLGYVGLPVALAFSRKFVTTGFDVNPRRVADLGRGHDHNGEHTAEELAAGQIRFTADPADLAGATFFVIAVIFSYFAVPARYQYRVLLWGRGRGGPRIRRMRAEVL